jgi:hypothetical protein
VIGLATGGSKENSNPPIQSKSFEVNSTSSTIWKYFSFAKNDTIVVSDPLTSEEWDLAFQRYRIKTNGGMSGSGQGSAANSYLKGQIGFDALKTVPDTATFSADASVNIAVQLGYATFVINPEFYTWFNIELAAQGTQIVPPITYSLLKPAMGNTLKYGLKAITAQQIYQGTLLSSTNINLTDQKVLNNE